MPPIERFGRVEEGELRGVWLRPTTTEYRWCAPVRLPAGGLGVCLVELRLEPAPASRRVSWAVLTRGGPVLDGAFDLPAVASWQALAAVERALADAGVALDGRGG